MSWYAQMMKSTEMARERNRREARRAQGEKYGPQFVAQYRMAVLDKEKRMIEKELERIRKGIHKTPRMENTDKMNLVGPSPRYHEHKLHESAINPEYSKDENNLYNAILFLQNNPSALVPILTTHAQSDAYLETLERITPRLTNEVQPKQPFVPKYLKQPVSNTEKDDLLKKYTALLHRHSPVLRRSSPLLKRNYRNSPVAHRYSPVHHLHSPVHRESPLLHDRASGNGGKLKTDADDGPVGTFLTEQEDEHPGSTVPPISGTPRQKLPTSIAQLAEDGMSSARDNISRRLSSTNTGNTAASAGDEPPASGRKLSTTGDESQSTTEEKPRPKALVMFPSVDPEIYNPDGTLRTCLNMPSFDSAWKEAQKARYIRTRELLERDRELSVKEIFEKK